MQPQAEIPGVGTVTVTPRFASAPEVQVDGLPVRRDRRTYLLAGTNGVEVPATLQWGVLDSYPTVVANGQRYRTGPRTPAWLVVAALLPVTVGVVLAGGLPPFILGATGAAGNLAILRSVRPEVTKLGLMLAVLAAVYLITFSVGILT